MSEILLNAEYKIIKPIEDGCSTDKKYYLESYAGEKYLLRISDAAKYEMKKNEFEVLKEIERLGISFSKPVSFGLCDDGSNVYTLLEWVDGVDLEKSMVHLNEKEQYLLGLKAGKTLKRIHRLKPDTDLDDWFDRYHHVILPRIEAYQAEGIYFEGSESILAFLEENKDCLHNRTQCRHHGDYHIGNMILEENDELGIIDWHTIDFENVGDPWYEFNRINTDYPAFASGQINGYFDGTVPNEFWKLFAYYLSASAITSIVWAKYYSPESLDEMMSKNYEVLVWFDNMQNPIPSWFHTINF